jgi:membrane-associated phospholipid phosphatase
MFLSRLLRTLGLVHLVLAALVAVLVVTEPRLRRYSDSLQVALPVLAWGCAATEAGGREFALRMAVLLGLTHGTKALLGEAALNLRPSGHPGGFPSAHTGAAVFGASALVQGCLAGSPLGQVGVIAAAAFTGASRLALAEHTVWQVLGGALLGWHCSRLMRRGRAREMLIRGWSATRAALGRRLPPRPVATLCIGLSCAIGLVCLSAPPVLG